METKLFAELYIQGLKDTLRAFDYSQYHKIIEQILKAYDEQRHIFVMGNGGSGATASHFACDINKGCCIDLARKFKMLCLNDNVPTLMALANDVSYDVVFEEQLKNFFLPQDVVIGLSGSGNSENVLRAMRYAKQHGGVTIGLSGFSGGALASIVDVPFVVPVNDMQKVEDIHMIVVHMIMQTVYGALHSLSGCEPLSPGG